MQEQSVPNQPANRQNTDSRKDTQNTNNQNTDSQDAGSKAVGKAVATQNGSGSTITASLGQVPQRVLTMVVGLLLMLCLTLWGMYALKPSDPYIQSVLQLSGDVSRGHDIFQLNCATCHGLKADGEVGPTLRDISDRKSRVALIQQVISGQTPPMPQFQPNERDMADLLAFLETL